MASLYDAAKKAAATFSRSCGVMCNILYMDCPNSLDRRLEIPFCSLCVNEQLKRFKTIRCENLHVFAAHQSERWGGKYEYMCPCNLAFVCSAASEDAKIKYCLYAGPFLMVETDDFIHYDLEAFFHGKHPRKLVSESKNLPYIESQRISSLADTLYALCSVSKQCSLMEIQIAEQVAKTNSEVFYSLYGIKVSDTSIYEYPIGHEKLLQGYIARGDKASAQKILNEILGHIFFCSGGNFDIIKARITELIVLLSRAAIEGGASIAEVFGLNCNYLNEISRFKNLDDLNFWLSKVLIRFTTTVFDISIVKHSETIKKIVQYIRSNYMKKLTLNDISDHVSFSVSYVCKLFKDEMKTSLTDFINKTRVENARIMLLDHSIPLIDITYLCGFDDQSYFTKVFRKESGLTPRQYRDKRSKSASYEMRG